MFSTFSFVITDKLISIIRYIPKCWFQYWVITNKCTKYVKRSRRTTVLKQTQLKRLHNEWLPLQCHCSFFHWFGISSSLHVILSPRDSVRAFWLPGDCFILALFVWKLGNLKLWRIRACAKARDDKVSSHPVNPRKSLCYNVEGVATYIVQLESHWLCGTPAAAERPLFLIMEKTILLV